MLRELLRRIDMMVIFEDQLDALVRLHTPWPPGLIGRPPQHGIVSNLSPESFYGPNAGLTEVLIPAGYVATVYDPIFSLSKDGTRYVSVASDTPTSIPEPGLPFSLVFRAEPGKEDILLKIASAYEFSLEATHSSSSFRPAASEAACKNGMIVEGRKILTSHYAARRWCGVRISERVVFGSFSAILPNPIAGAVHMTDA